jgi:hypothetical protein
MQSMRLKSAVQEVPDSSSGRQQSADYEAAVSGPGGGSQRSRRWQSAVLEVPTSGPGGTKLRTFMRMDQSNYCHLIIGISS